MQCAWEDSRFNGDTSPGIFPLGHLPSAGQWEASATSSHRPPPSVVGCSPDPSSLCSGVGLPPVFSGLLSIWSASFIYLSSRDVLDVQMLCPLYCRWPSTTTWAMSRKEKVPYWPPGCVYKSCCGDDCKSQSILFINTFESCFNWIWYSCLSSHETSPDWRWRSNGQAQSSK